MQKVTAVSERRACQLVGVSRSTLRYEPTRSEEDQQLRSKIVELAQERRRFGYRRIHALLRRDGVEVNHKRVYRLYREANLAVKRRKRRKGVAVPREPLSLPAQRNEVWSMDFVMDALSHGRRIKILTIVDDCTKEAVDLVADFGISGALCDPCAGSGGTFSRLSESHQNGSGAGIYRSCTGSVGL